MCQYFNSALLELDYTKIQEETFLRIFKHCARADRVFHDFFQNMRVGERIGKSRGTRSLGPTTILGHFFGDICCT